MNHEANERPPRGKPHFGLTAVGYFLSVGALGLVGMAVMIGGLLLGGIGGTLVAVLGGLTGIPALYMALGYIPLYLALYRGDAPAQKAMVRLAGIQGHEKVLDVGSGTGRLAVAFARRLTYGRVTGVDGYSSPSGPSPEAARRNAAVAGVAGRVEFQDGNPLSLPFADGAFDIVAVGSFMQEIQTRAKKLQALQEVGRVLKPGGRLVMLEIVRTRCLSFLLLLFAFAFQSREYWLGLLAEAGLGDVEVARVGGPVTLDVYIVRKV